jgi:hypothetical protein
MFEVFSQLLISMLPALQLGLTPAPAAVGKRVVRVAQSDTGPADAVVSKIAAGERARAAKGREMVRLGRVYEAQLKEVDRLKKRRSSWRRDNLIRTQLRKAQQTARRLRVISNWLRAMRKRLRSERRSLVITINRELRGEISAKRRAKLLRWRAAARRSLKRKSRKIVLPNSKIDPLADPEDLDAQARRIQQAEKRLAAEIAKLAKRAKRYKRMVALRKKRRRAAQLGRMDDNRPRRTTGRGGSGSRGSGEVTGLSSNGDPASGGGASPTPADSDAGFIDMGEDGGDPSVVLADVVDSSTIDELRKAESSNDPKAKAKAAERARKQVQARLERLRKRRKAIQGRAKRLRTKRRRR